MPKDTLRADAFLAATERTGIEAIVGSDVCHVLHEHWRTGALSLDFERPEEAAERVVRACADRPVDALVPLTESAAVVAALAAERLGLPFNSPSATRTARNKRLFREALEAAGLPRPAHEVTTVDESPEALPRQVSYPCVLKPVLLSASRGVIRADDHDGLTQGLQRIGALLNRPELRGLRDPDRNTILLESYIAGPELALEGLLDGGQLRTLALFDKPDRMEGPYFEETLLVTPSRQPDAIQERVRNQVEAALHAIGLHTGPVHAEVRLPPGGPPTVLEVAGRTIGGLCGQALEFAGGYSLEELVLRHAVGTLSGPPRLREQSAGVLMIPIPAAGVLNGVDGVDRARAVEGVQDVVINPPLGTKLVPLPEGGDYLGFLFARADTPQAVEHALRTAHAELRFHIARALT